MLSECQLPQVSTRTHVVYSRGGDGGVRCRKYQKAVVADRIAINTLRRRMGAWRTLYTSHMCV